MSREEELEKRLLERRIKELTQKNRILVEEIENFLIKQGEMTEDQRGKLKVEELVALSEKWRTQLPLPSS